MSLPARIWRVTPGWQWRVVVERYGDYDPETGTGEVNIIPADESDGPYPGIRGGWAPTKEAARDRVAAVRAEVGGA